MAAILLIAVLFAIKRIIFLRKITMGQQKNKSNRVNKYIKFVSMIYSLILKF